jgi:penicillin-binding protein 1A
MIFDAPALFINPDGTTYQPMNYLGEWVGPVRLRTALARSMNVPSVKVLEGIGFDAAIQRASALLGLDEEHFDRVYPLGLGIVSVAPIQMARAYSTFPNQGKVVDPLAIRFIEDTNGTIILEHEKDMIKENSKREPIMTPQEAYVMVNMLQSTVAWGTLARRARDVGGFDGMEMAGKTGTHQNWSNAWTVGFSPYYTTAVWFGFDLPGNSLGLNQTGATAAGPVWAKYMKTIHESLPKRKFAVPDTGLITRQVCSVSGMLPTDKCDDGTVEEIFLLGTEPTKPCEYHDFKIERDLTLTKRIQDRLLLQSFSLDSIETPTITPPRFGTFDPETEPTSEETEEGNPLLD